MRTALKHLQADLTRKGFDALNRVTVPAVKAGLATPPLIGFGLVVLETTGRISGQPRQVPLVATRFGRHLNVSTVRSESAWVKNLQAQPDAAVWIGGRKRDITSTIETGTLNIANLTLT